MSHYFWFALRSVPQVGSVLFRRLVERFGTPEAVLHASGEDLLRVRGVNATVVNAIRHHDYRDSADQECRAVARLGVRIVDFRAPDYPRLLLEIPDPPPFLYVRGELADDAPAVAIVGSRRASGYGLLATGRLARELAERDITVVSGLARGIDTAAHRGAQQGGGRTVAVLGCGLDIVYPPENAHLFAEIAAQGALVSEFPLGTPPLAENFPRRNRIISGLSRGVLVVEAAEKSGSLITARMALEQGREVFAIPGNITQAASRGTNRLIKEGAKLVEEVADILEELPAGPRQPFLPLSLPLPNLSSAEGTLHSLLAEGPLHIDEIVVKSKLTVAEVSAILLSLELKGVVQQLPGKYFTAS